MYIILVSLLIVLLFTGIRIVKPNHRGVVERFGKVRRFVNPGYLFVIPVIDQIQTVYLGEQLLNSPQTSYQTMDNRVVMLDVKIYFHLKSHNQSLMRALYEIKDYQREVREALQSSLNEIIGEMSLGSINNYLGKIKVALLSSMVNKLNTLDIRIDRVVIQTSENK